MIRIKRYTLGLLTFAALSVSTGVQVHAQSAAAPADEIVPPTCLELVRHVQRQAQHRLQTDGDVLLDKFWRELEASGDNPFADQGEVAASVRDSSYRFSIPRPLFRADPEVGKCHVDDRFAFELRSEDLRQTFSIEATLIVISRNPQQFPEPRMDHWPLELTNLRNFEDLAFTVRTGPITADEQVTTGRAGSDRRRNTSYVRMAPGILDTDPPIVVLCDDVCSREFENILAGFPLAESEPERDNEGGRQEAAEATAALVAAENQIAQLREELDQSRQRANALQNMWTKPLSEVIEFQPVDSNGRPEPDAPEIRPVTNCQVKHPANLLEALAGGLKKDCWQVGDGDEWEISLLGNKPVWEGDRLRLQVFVRPQQEQRIGNIKVDLGEDPGFEARDCVVSLSVTTEDADLKRNLMTHWSSTSGEERVQMYTGNPIELIFDSNPFKQLLPTGVRWENLSLVFEADGENSSCALDRTEPITLANYKDDDRIDIDQEGNVTVRGLDLRSTKPNVAVYLALQKGYRGNDGASNSLAAAGYWDDPRDRRDYLKRFVQALATGLQGEDFNHLKIYAPAADNTAQLIFDDTISNAETAVRRIDQALSRDPFVEGDYGDGRAIAAFKTEIDARRLDAETDRFIIYGRLLNEGERHLCNFTAETDVELAQIKDLSIIEHGKGSFRNETVRMEDPPEKRSWQTMLWVCSDSPYRHWFHAVNRDARDSGFGADHHNTALSALIDQIKQRENSQ